MTEPVPEARIRTGGRLAAGIAGLSAVVLATALGVPAAGLASALAGGLLAGGTRSLTADDNQERAKGSLGVVVGGAAFCGALGLATRASPGHLLLVGMLTLGVTFVTLDALVEVPERASSTVGETIKRSAVVLVLAAVLSVVVHAGGPLDAVTWTVGASAALLGYGDFLSLVLLQVLALASVLLVQLALPILDDWVPDRGEDSLAGARQIAVHPGNVPWGVWVLLSLELVVVAIDPGGAWFEGVLGSLSSLGTVVHLVLAYGVFHAPLAVLCALAGTVLFARQIQRAFVWWAGRNPPETLGYAAGGVVVGAVAVVVTAIPPVSALLDAAAAAAMGPNVVATNGAAAVGLFLVVVALVAFRLLLFVLPALDDAKVLPSPGGYAAGAAVLFVATLGAAGMGATPIAVFVGVAAALLAWDLGRNATILRKQLGRRVDTRDAEVTHATASVLVGALAVGVATFVLYVLGPDVLAPPSKTRAVVSAVLSVVALLAFVVLVER